MFKREKKEELQELDLLQGIETEEGDGTHTEELAGMEGISQGEAKKKKKLPGWVIIPILLVLVLFFFGLSKLSKGGDKTASVNTVKVEKSDIKQIYNTSGTVESEKTKIFYSPVNAPILGFTAEVGTSVKAGDLLVSFDTTNLERDNQQSELNALSTKYTNQDAAEQSNRAASTANQTKAQTEASIADTQKQIAAKQKEVNNLQNELSQSAGETAQNAQKAAEISQKMQKNLNDQSSQKAIRDNAELELAKLNTSDSNYSSLLQTAQAATTEIGKLEVAYRELEAQLNELGSTDTAQTATALAAAQQELDALNTSLNQLKNSSQVTTDTGLTKGQAANMKVSENLTELAQLTTEELLKKGQEGIKAEFDGIISDVKAAEGTSAVQGGELFTLVSNQDVNVKLQVSANDFDNLSVGSKAEIKVGKKTYQGTLTEIDKIALVNEKGSSTIGAKVHIDNPDDDLYIGVNAKVTMTVAEEKNVLCLPSEVVNTSSDGEFVYIIENGKVKEQPVELGISSSSKVQILSGLKEGTQVVSDSDGSVKKGMKATATPAKDTSDKE